MLHGGEFLMTQVSMKALWWLAFARIINATFTLLPLASMKVEICVPSAVRVSCCDSGLIVLFMIPDRLICVTLSLIISDSVFMFSFSRRLDSDLDDSLAMIWLCWLGEFKIICNWLLV